MASLDTSAQTTPSARWRWPSIHPEGRKFVVIAGAVTLLTAGLVAHWLGWLMLGLTIWVAAFFRDPIRSVPQGQGLIVAPADGLVTMIQEVMPPRELTGADALEAGLCTRVGFTQIAGLVARRIVPFVKEGDLVAVGQRVGLIRFGSRVDVYLPAGAAPKVALGQRSIAGETVLARLGDAERATGRAL